MKNDSCDTSCSFGFGLSENGKSGLPAGPVIVHGKVMLRADKYKLLSFKFVGHILIDDTLVSSH